MNCDDFKHLLHLEYTGKLTNGEIPELRKHRQACERCDAFSRIAEELSCKAFTELLHDYIDGTLPPERRDVFDRHLSICPDCAAYLDSYRATMSMSALVMKQELRNMADGMPEELVRAILSACSEEPSRNRGDD